MVFYYNYEDDNYEDKVVQYCRQVFDKRYNNYWIDTLEKEEEEVINKFKLVEIDLYPKHINLRNELIKRGIRPPKKIKFREPKRPIKSRYKREEKYEEALAKYEEEKEKYDKLREENRKEWKQYKSIVYDLIHKDIDDSKKKNITPINLVIEQVKLRFNVKEELKKQGVKIPKKLTAKESKKPIRRRYRTEEEFKEALSKYNKDKDQYNTLKAQNQEELKNYRIAAYNLLHKNRKIGRKSKIEIEDFTIKKNIGYTIKVIH